MSEAETSILENEQKLCIGVIYQKCNFNLCKFMKKENVFAKKSLFGAKKAECHRQKLKNN